MIALNLKESLSRRSDTPAIYAQPATNSAEKLPSPNTEHESDDILALGAPALVLGIVLIGAGFAGLLLVRSWSRDYGSLLVVVVYAVYMSLAGSLSVWGLRLARRQRLRALRSDTGQQNSTASSVAETRSPERRKPSGVRAATQRSDRESGGPPSDRTGR
ncbi:hypothetical protein [Nocardia anaemiae]|uniref:hypothetical protein n=1 Tax=Nocardia anaemiae TaxID=263910 RepID=UPI000AE59896|nr:hypothetical protein [Nocardia anaemiae]